MLRSRCLVLFVLGLLALPATAQFQPWRVMGGDLVLRLDQAGLSGAGLVVVEADQTGGSPGAISADAATLDFKVSSTSDLMVLVGDSGEFVSYGVLGGGALIEGGFALVSPSTGLMADFHGARFHHMPAHTDGPGGNPDPDYMYLTGSQAAPGQDFIVRSPKIHFDPVGASPYTPSDHVQPLVSVMSWDLVVSDALAARLHRPDLAGAILGGGELLATVQPWTDAWSYPPGLNPWSPFGGGRPGDAESPDAGPDISLGLLSTIAEKIHSGTFPNGRQSMAMSTTACNVGTTSVLWQAAMDPDHPGIAQQLYRMMGDRFEQVGVAWIKHGFFATNQSNCAPCSTPGGPGNQLGVNCSDTYGTNNNADPMWLGPRSEWDGFNNTWTCLGSFFDGVPVDCIRSESGASFLGLVDHRLEAFDFDLGLPGATYVYEALYMVQGDVDKNNNIGSRLCSMTWTGTIWDIVNTPGTNPLVMGPAINRWGDLRTQVGLGPFDGDAIVGVKTRDLGGGLWRYEWAVFNWNMDRQLRSFSVPTGGGTPTAFYFHDIDNLPANDWVPTVSGGNVTWEFPDVFLPGVKVAGPMEYGTLYNFGFTCDVAPGDRNSTLAPHVPGLGGDLLGAATLAPAGLNLTSTKLAPAEGEAFSLVMSGGSDHMMVAVMEVSGVPLSTPVLIGPVPFVGGTASIPLVLPVGVSGLDFVLVGGDVSVGPLDLLELGNFITLAVQ